MSNLNSKVSKFQITKNIARHMVDMDIPVAVVMEDDAMGSVAPNFVELVQLALNHADSYDIFR